MEAIAAITVSKNRDETKRLISIELQNRRVGSE